MSNDKKPEFLTDEIEIIFRTGGNDYNKNLAVKLENEAHRIQHQTPTMKAGSRRADLGGIINSYIESSEHLKPDNVSNMWGFRFQEKWFVRIIKLDSLDKDSPPKQSKTIKKAIRKALQGEDKPTQAQMFEDEVEPEPLDIGKLKHGIVAYHVTPDGYITGFSFATYTLPYCTEIENIYHLDLNSTSNVSEIIRPEFEESNTSTVIKLKASHTSHQNEDEA